MVGGLALAMVSVQRRRAAEQRQFAVQLLAAQEEERARVAREVHDDAVQRLVLIAHELDELAQRNPGHDPAAGRVQSIREEVDMLSDDLRMLAQSLHPGAIQAGGIGAALTLLAEEMWRVHGLRVTLALPERAPEPSPSQALTLYRITQEALRNVSRHAGVDQAEVSLTASDTAWELEISDSGRGFAGEADGHGRGVGLRSIRERARLADATATVRSVPGGGTRVRVVMPVGSRLP